MGRQAVIRSLQSYYDEGGFLADLRRRVAIPTESQIASRRPELYQYLETEIAPALRALDYAVTIYDNPDPAGGPFLIGRRIEDPGISQQAMRAFWAVRANASPRMKQAIEPRF